MARRRKGRDISGWVLVDKPAGVTSSAVVNKVRWAFDARKAGHAGTLDPDATGMLPVALGEATKTIAYLGDALKAYDFTMRFGAETSTDDASGDPTLLSDHRPTDPEIEAALPDFVGTIDQVPPQVSAVKVDGARAYDLARDGVEMTLAARETYVESLRLLARPDADHARLEFVCGSGGYVRAIARDLGRALGSRAHVLSLRRLWVGPFDLEESVTMDEIETHARTEEIDTVLHPVALALSHLVEVTATESGAVRLKNGNPGGVLPSDAEYGDLVWASRAGVPVAIGRLKGAEVHPERVFNL